MGELIRVNPWPRTPPAKGKTGTVIGVAFGLRRRSEKAAERRGWTHRDIQRVRAQEERRWAPR